MIDSRLQFQRKLADLHRPCSLHFPSLNNKRLANVEPANRTRKEISCTINESNGLEIRSQPNHGAAILSLPCIAIYIDRRVLCQNTIKLYVTLILVSHPLASSAVANLFIADRRGTDKAKFTRRQDGAVQISESGVYT